MIEIINKCIQNKILLNLFCVENYFIWKFLLLIFGKQRKFNKVNFNLKYKLNNFSYEKCAKSIKNKLLKKLT